MAKSPLGRGLSALLSGNASPEITPNPKAVSGAVELSMKQIRACSFQPRKVFDEDSLKDLAASIRSQGIVQPLVVRRFEDSENSENAEDAFELIAGERRWRAAQLAGLQKVPAIIRDLSNREGLELALVENLQREDLNPVEEAVGYQQLIEQFELRQDEVAQKVGKSRASITNAIRLLKLPASVQSFLKKGLMSVGHAKVILAAKGDHIRTSLAARVVKGNLSVRETETLVNKAMKNSSGSTSKSRRSDSHKVKKDANLIRIEEQIRQRFQTKVSLKYHRGKGSVEMQFFTDEDLERLIGLLGVAVD